MATHIKEVAYVKLAVHVKVTVHIKVTSHVKEAHHVKESDSSPTNRSGGKDMRPVQAKPAARSIGRGTCEPWKLPNTDNKTSRTEEASEVAKTDKTNRTEEISEVAKTDKTNHTEETSEVAKTDNKAPCTDELSEEARAVIKDFAAHDNKKSGAVRLTRYTAMALNDTLKTGAVGKLPTEADGNSKPYKKAKLDYSSGSRSMRVIEDKEVGTTGEHHLVAKASSMSHDVEDCRVSRRGLGRLTCHTACRTRRQSVGRCRRSQMQRHQGSPSAHVCALPPTYRQVRVMPLRLTSMRTVRLRGHCAAYRICGTPPTASTHKTWSCNTPGPDLS